jgi:hypothetical protein
VAVPTPIDSSKITAKLAVKDSNGNVVQIWYQYELDVPFPYPWNSAMQITHGWMVGALLDTSANKWYDYLHGLCFAPEPTSLTFYYDRAAAGKFGMAQANENDILNPRNLDGKRRVSHPLDDVPFSNLEYDGGGAGTDSALFISEIIWAGGMPMTTIGNLNECGLPSVSASGWRYCNKDEMGILYPNIVGGWASRNWRQHQGLLVYYTGTSNNIPGVESGSNTILAGSHGDYLGTFTRRDLTGFFNNKFQVTDATSLDIWTSNYLGSVRAGDYILIDPEGQDYHGFFVAGWGPIETLTNTCSLPISRKYTTLDISKPTQGNTVPYVVDFSNLDGDPNNRTQAPVARPFYCSKYDSGIADTFFGNNRNHSWYVFRLPSTVQVSVSSVYFLTR